MNTPFYTPPAASDNVSEYSVKDLSNALKRTLEDRFGHVRVRAELSSVKIAASGHGYMSLKDQASNDVLDGVCWRGSMAKFDFTPKEGMEVIASGKITTYGDRSKYQMIIDHIALAGQGALLQRLQELKQKLQAEGLFEQSRKRAIPYLPDHIGVVTSPTGAVIRDILHRLQDRFPRNVLLWSSLVQGANAARELVQAIEGLNALPSAASNQEDIPTRPDVIIVARGGGSLEDLMAFNDEAVVRAVFNSKIPIISAVGHETDVTLCDFAADLRAPTPTAAAEMAVPVLSELRNGIMEWQLRLDKAADRHLMRQRQQFEGWARGLLTPENLMQNALQRLDDRFERLRQASRTLYRQKIHGLRAAQASLKPPSAMMRYAQQNLAAMDARLAPSIFNQLHKYQQKLDILSDRLEANSFKSVLARGYSVIKDEQGNLIQAGNQAQIGQKLEAHFQDEAVLGLRVESKT
ncbi:MAG: exodeoxyribonuclease VII large subunit [Alphaproteobacteria bacterium]